jgi:hypothetical protein
MVPEPRNKVERYIVITQSYGANTLAVIEMFNVKRQGILSNKPERLPYVLKVTKAG